MPIREFSSPLWHRRAIAVPFVTDADIDEVDEDGGGRCNGAFILSRRVVCDGHAVDSDEPALAAREAFVSGSQAIVSDTDGLVTSFQGPVSSSECGRGGSDAGARSNEAPV